MRFTQLDSITEIVPGKMIVATRTVRAEEDFLRDHFPLFPVLPGVLMVEALFQASCWLIRESENYAHAVLTLNEAKSVKFADFMEPGQTLTINAEFLKSSDDSATIKATGTKGDVVAVSARLIVGKSNLGAKDASLSPLDAFMRATMRETFDKLCTLKAG